MNANERDGVTDASIIIWEFLRLGIKPVSGDNWSLAAVGIDRLRCLRTQIRDAVIPTSILHRTGSDGGGRSWKGWNAELKKKKREKGEMTNYK